MGLLGRKKKKESIKETAEELKAKLKELEGEHKEELPKPDQTEEDLLPEPPQPPKEEKKDKEDKPETGGKFSLSESEMALAVNALSLSEEFKVYQQMVIGQQIAEIIESYNKAIEGKSEVPSAEDTNKLPLHE